MIGHNPMMCNGNLQCNFKGDGDGCGISWIGDLGDAQNPWRMVAHKHLRPHSVHNESDV